VDRNTVLWVLVLFFGTSLVFGALRRLTEDESAGVTIAVQLGALALILAAVFAFVRWRRSPPAAATSASFCARGSCLMRASSRRALAASGSSITAASSTGSRLRV
jgi:hypothetical protein